MSIEQGEGSQSIPEVPLEKTTLTEVIPSDYVPAPHAFSDEAKLYSRLIQRLCLKADRRGKHFLQLAFNNGTRVYRIYKNTDPKPGTAKYYVKGYPHLTDDFRKTDS